MICSMFYDELGEERSCDLVNADISAWIEKHSLVRSIDKKRTLGEVLTPRSLVDAVLNQFPVEVWSNPDLKWLEPSCGTGNFALCICWRLFRGLRSWQPDPVIRLQHVLNSMLYMIDISQENIDICRQLFGSNVLLLCSDFFECVGEGGCWNNVMFDCVVGNPPFQEMGKRGGKSKLADRFVMRCLDKLVFNDTSGYMSMIVPSNMFSGWGSVVYSRLLSPNNHHSWHIDQLRFGVDAFFGSAVQQSMCTFFLMPLSRFPCAIAGLSKTRIINVGRRRPRRLHKTYDNDDELSVVEVDLQLRPVNPVSQWTVKTEALVSTGMQLIKNGCLYNRGKPLSFYLSSHGDGEYIELIYTPTKRLYTADKLWAVGHGFKKVVVFAIGARFSFEVDWTGSLGVGPNTFYIPFDTVAEGEAIVARFNSDDFLKLVDCCKTTRQFLKIGFMEFVRLS